MSAQTTKPTDGLDSKTVGEQSAPEINVTTNGCPECGTKSSLTGFCHGRFIGPYRKNPVAPRYLPLDYFDR